MVEKSIRGAISHVVHRYVKANNKCKKDYDPITDLMYWDVSNLYGWVLSHKLPVDGFKCKKKTSRFTQKIVQNCNNGSEKGCLLEIDLSYPKNLNNLHSDLMFPPKRMNIKKWLSRICMTIKSILY